jgi:hypothetical protein
MAASLAPAQAVDAAQSACRMRDSRDLMDGWVASPDYGSGAHAGFPESVAIRNADSWALLCADRASRSALRTGRPRRLHWRSVGWISGRG